MNSENYCRWKKGYRHQYMGPAMFKSTMSNQNSDSSWVVYAFNSAFATPDINWLLFGWGTDVFIETIFHCNCIKWFGAIATVLASTNKKGALVPTESKEFKESFPSSMTHLIQNTFQWRLEHVQFKTKSRNGKVSQRPLAIWAICICFKAVELSKALGFWNCPAATLTAAASVPKQVSTNDWSSPMATSVVLFP